MEKELDDLSEKKSQGQINERMISIGHDAINNVHAQYALTACTNSDKPY